MKSEFGQYFAKSLIEQNNVVLFIEALGNKNGAIVDLHQSAELYQTQSKTEDYQDALNQLKNFSLRRTITKSLPSLTQTLTTQAHN